MKTREITRFTDEQFDEMLELHDEQGFSYKEIANWYGTTTMTIFRLLDDYRYETQATKATKNPPVQEVWEDHQLSCGV